MTFGFGFGSRRAPRPSRSSRDPSVGQVSARWLHRQPRIVREPLNAAAASRIRIYVLTKVGGRRARIPSEARAPPRRPPRLARRVFACLLVSLWPLGVFLPGAHTRSRLKLRARYVAYVAYRTAAAASLSLHESLTPHALRAHTKPSQHQPIKSSQRSPEPDATQR